MPIASTIGIDARRLRTITKRTAQRMLRRMVEAQKELVKLQTPRPPTPRGQRYKRTGNLYRSIDVRVVDGAAALVILATYWPFVLEYGSYLNHPTRRVEPQNIVSGAATKVLGQMRAVLGGEIRHAQLTMNRGRR